MKELDIQTYGKTNIDEILGKNETRYSVSIFQRDYSWTKDQWEKLYDDIVSSLEENREHFFGFMTFYRPKDSLITQIIEGQQRLATVTILACVIRDQLLENGNENWKAINDDLVKPAHWHKSSYYKLELSANDKHFFREHVQKEGVARSKILQMRKLKRLKTSNRLIKQCYAYFDEKLRSASDLPRFLWQATGKFVVISSDVKSLNSAYVLFQTLNDRSLKLTTSDLLKTHLLRKAKNDWREIKEIWDSILDLPEMKDMNVFLRNYWLSKKGVVKKEELFAKFSEEIRKKEQACMLVHELKKEAEAYSMLLEAREDYFNGEKTIPDLLKKLYLLSTQQVMPLLLASYSFLDMKDFKKTIKSLTVLIFRYLTIGEKENKKLERSFSEMSMKIRDSREYRNATSIVEELKRSIYVDDEGFKQDFKKKMVRDPKIAKYILKEIEQSLSGEREKEIPANITLEHILPEHPSEECKRGMQKDGIWEYRDEWIHRIGNMTLLLGKDNEGGQNDSPAVKSSKVYVRSRLRINDELQNLMGWTSKDIEKRQEWMANTAVEIWKL